MVRKKKKGICLLSLLSKICTARSSFAGKMFSLQKRFQFFLFLSKTKIPGLDLNKEIKIRWFQESLKSTTYLPSVLLKLVL